MNMLLKSTAVALALAGAALMTAGTSNAAGIFLGIGTGDSHHYGNRSGPLIAIGFGDIAYGYRDGYWDNGHQWHHWSNDGDYRTYRDRRGSNYHDWNHNRDQNNGWLRN
jgi:hypothetical protein